MRNNNGVTKISNELSKVNMTLQQPTVISIQSITCDLKINLTNRQL